MNFKDVKSTKGIIAAIVIIALISAVIEIFIFNFRFYLPLLNHAPYFIVTPSDFSNLSGCEIDGGNLVITDDNATFTINGVNKPLYGARINYFSNNPTIYSSDFATTIMYTDQNFSENLQNSTEFNVFSSVPASNQIHFKTDGNCRTITFTIAKDLGTRLDITSIAFNHEQLYFEFPRFLAVFLILLCCFIVKRFRLYNKILDFRNNYQRGAAIILVVLGVFFTVFIYVNSRAPDSYFSTSVVQKDDAYQRETEAFYHGQVAYLVKPSEELQKLSNPYDESLRNLNNVDILWDSAYYKGNYFSYFGLAPILLLLLPFKFLTGLYMPTDFAILIFTLFTIIAAAELYQKIIRRWFRKTSFMMYIFGLVGVIFAADLFWTMSRPLFYELAVISSTFFMLLAFNILMSAELLIKNSEVYEEINLTRRINLRLVFAGLSLALMVASRPNFVLYIAAALPFIIKIYMHQRKTKGNFKALRNISLNFGIPLACFAIIIMYYNFARFGSPFEFGAKCQLTVSNVNYNKITDITKAINGFFSYLVQPLGFNLNFPFFHVLKVIPSSITQYMYNFPSAGIFNIPLLLILPASFFIITRMPKYDLKKQWLYVTVIVCMIMIYINATIAGVQMRYTLDIVPILTFAAVILWLEVYAWFDRRGAGKPISRVFTVVVLISSIISMLICLVGENNYIQQLNPSFYYYLSGLFEFWR